MLLPGLHGTWYYESFYNECFPKTSTKPSTPTDFAVTAISSSQIDLSWYVSAGADGYRIYKDGAYLKSVTTTSTSDTGLSAATNYCYYVTAYNSAGESVQTSQLCATTQAIPSFIISGTITSSGIGLAGVSVTLSGTGATSTLTASNGTFTLTNVSNGSYTLSAAKEGYTISPASKSVTVNGANVTGQDFTATIVQPPLADMVLIPAGTFQMGDAIDGMSSAKPVHTVTVSAFYLDKYEVTKALWDEVYTWATAHGYPSTMPVQERRRPPGADSLLVRRGQVVECPFGEGGRTPVYYTDVGQTVIYRTGQVNVDQRHGEMDGERLSSAHGGGVGVCGPRWDDDAVLHGRLYLHGSGEL